MLPDHDKMAEQVVYAVKSFVHRLTATLSKRVELMDERIAQIPAGPQGDIGPVGPQGKDGAPGERGAQGDIGPQGKDGAPGERGPQGEPGIQGKDGAPGAPGSPGERGAPGPVGLQGADGVPGVKGDPGLQGPPGEKGLQGEPGPQGEIGPQGPQGEIGPQGPQGEIGPQGPQGEIGQHGEIGPQGKDGAPGEIGPAGKDGPPGPMGNEGKEGPPGIPGSIGPAGKDGAPGKDVDPELVQRLLASIDALQKHADELEAILKKTDADITRLKEQPVAPSSFVIEADGKLVAVYPNGATKDIGMVRGKDGVRGASVMDGSVDDQGQLVLRMSDGRILNIGAVRGKNGTDGKEGKQGIPGRDAIELRVLPGIDDTKSYPEATLAEYAGGIIRAERRTDPIVDGDVVAAGWRVAMQGIAHESEQELDDGRIVERTTVYTGGKTFARQYQTNKLIWRGIWKDNVSYAKGDTVTWAGSLWHCQNPSTQKPGDSDNWKLCVKHGAPGRDGKSVKGDPGPPGRVIRDAGGAFGFEER